MRNNLNNDIMDTIYSFSEKEYAEKIVEELTDDDTPIEFSPEFNRRINALYEKTKKRTETNRRSIYHVQFGFTNLLYSPLLKSGVGNPPTSTRWHKYLSFAFKSKLYYILYCPLQRTNIG